MITGRSFQRRSMTEFSKVGRNNTRTRSRRSAAVVVVIDNNVSNIDLTGLSIEFPAAIGGSLFGHIFLFFLFRITSSTAAIIGSIGIPTTVRFLATCSLGSLRMEILEMRCYSVRNLLFSHCIALIHTLLQGSLETYRRILAYVPHSISIGTGMRLQSLCQQAGRLSG